MDNLFPNELSCCNSVSSVSAVSPSLDVAEGVHSPNPITSASATRVPAPLDCTAGNYACAALFVNMVAFIKYFSSEASQVDFYQNANPLPPIPPCRNTAGEGLHTNRGCIHPQNASICICIYTSNVIALVSSIFVLKQTTLIFIKLLYPPRPQPSLQKHCGRRLTHKPWMHLSPKMDLCVYVFTCRIYICHFQQPPAVLRE